ncbi:hypothetical protein B0H67DRAFT_648451 [Lasiosphaeris hirsuta]|uniref:Uncharacterized protein n=1 Tax=Lasiosphaeris hirsuta TaxID=260670 RepID=A0AA40DP67_9PEZI|nr:hypothetical protein B0H67DRAFT_648451 [Lasiosphaeris hirsuta]
MSFAGPVTNGAWSYAGDLHVESSGHNRHRRASIPELKAHFERVEDRPAHWYEAQLLHYGLPPSKTKGTAKMRLFEAVSKDNLGVPAHIARVETELKKEWVKREREAKQALKKQAEPAVAKSTAASKRKANNISPGSNIKISVNVSVGPQGQVQILPPAGPLPKKAKVTKPAPAEKAAKTKTPAKNTTRAPKKKLPASKATTSARSGKTTAPAKTAANSRAKTTSTPIETPAKPRQKQTAKRSVPFGSSRIQSSPAPPPEQYFGRRQEVTLEDSDSDPPPPYPGSPRTSDDDSENDCGSDNSDRKSSSSYESSNDDTLPQLGLLNGRYNIESWRGHSDCALILTLDGKVLWGSFEIDDIQGIFRLKERPYQSSYRRLHFEWRAKDNNGKVYHGTDDDDSYMKFLGDGDVEGRIDLFGESYQFDGHRISGQPMRSEISAASMRTQWNEL